MKSRIFPMLCALFIGANLLLASSRTNVFNHGIREIYEAGGVIKFSDTNADYIEFGDGTVQRSAATGGPGSTNEPAWSAKSNQVLSVVGLAATNALPDATGYITWSITGSHTWTPTFHPLDLADTNWVLGLGYTTPDITNSLASTNWVIDQGYLPSSATNDLASTNWVGAQGYQSAASANTNNLTTATIPTSYLQSNSVGSAAWRGSNDFLNEASSLNYGNITNPPVIYSAIYGSTNACGTFTATNGLEVTTLVGTNCASIAGAVSTGLLVHVAYPLSINGSSNAALASDLYLTNSAGLDPRNYGALIDGVAVTDATMAASTNLVLSPGGLFSRATDGQTIEVPNAGPARGSLITTISSHTSTSAVVAATSSFTAPAGVTVRYSSDDTAAAQRWINDIYATGIHGQMPKGIMGIHGALSNGTFSTGASYNGQLLFPARDFSSGQVTIQIVGDSKAPVGGPAVPWADMGSVIWSTATNGNVFDVITVAETANQPFYSAVQIVMEKVTGLVPNSSATQASFLYAPYAAAVAVRDSAIRVTCPKVNLTNAPASSVAIHYPSRGNTAEQVLENTLIAGFGVGAVISEHATLIHPSFSFNGTALKLGDNLGSVTGPYYVANNIYGAAFYGNSQQIVVADTNIYLYGNAYFEDSLSATWNTTTNDLNNPNDWLIGDFSVLKLPYTGAFIDSTPAASTNLVLHNLTDRQDPLTMLAGGSLLITNIVNDNSAAGRVVVSGHTATVGTNATGVSLPASPSGKFYRDDGTFASADGVSQFDLVNMNFNTGTNVNWIDGSMWSVSNTVAMTNGYLTSDGIGGYVWTTNAPLFTNMTITAWVNPLGTNGNQTVVAYGVGTSLDAITFRITAGGVLAIGDGSAQRIVGISRIPLNTWSFVGATVQKVTASTANFALYINGLLDTNTSAATYSPAVPSTGFAIGAILTGSQVLSGRVDEVRISTNILSAADIRFRASEGMKQVNQ